MSKLIISKDNNNFNINVDSNLNLNGQCVVDKNGFLSAYPIGSIYICVNNVSPASLFGGTWEQINNKFLFASGSNYSLGTEGGEVEHVLTIDEMPKHTHSYNAPTALDSFASGKYTYNAVYLQDKTSSISGGDLAHNNMPPYLVVNIWKRTA